MATQLSKMRVSELRVECEQRGLDCTGLRKAQLIALLSDGDTTQKDNTLDEDRADENAGVIGSEEHNDLDEPVAAASETELQIAALKLKLKLADIEHKAQLQQLELEKVRWELEKERIKFRAENGSPNPVLGTKSQRDLKSLLPSMGDNDQALAFFHAYEKTLLIQKVDKSTWSLWLPSCLNAKASKVYSALTVEQCQQYDVVKKAVLDSFRLTSKKYLESFRSLRRTGQDLYTLFLNKLQEMQRYFLESKEISSLEKLIEQDLLEQFLVGLPPRFDNSWRVDSHSRPCKLHNLQIYILKRNMFHVSVDQMNSERRLSQQTHRLRR